jgi:hypothetical protein
MFITCSESHYSVLFSEDTSCAQSSDAIVELFYYDELGKQDELYRLTVTPNKEAGARASSEEADSRGAKEQKEGDLTPPIEHVIRTRTRWKGASVDWNGSEALL